MALSANQTNELQALAGRALTAAEVTLATNRQDNTLAASLSATLPGVLGSVSVPVFVAWAASTGLLAAIETAAATPTSPLYNAALAIKTMMGWQTGALDLSNSGPVGTGNQAMLAAWVTAGALTAAQQAALLALATGPAMPIPTEQVSAILNGA